MNPVDGGEAVDLVKGILGIASEAVDNVEVALFPPFPWLLGVAEVLEGSGVKLGAQDCFWEVSGAYTGEVSPAMLRGWCQWVIVGHSERRVILGETDDMVARKAAAALSAGLSVIVCVGEPVGAGAERKVRVIYGGSGPAANVESYVELPLCDGCLVGGASLKADEFAQIVRVTNEVYGHNR